jgi:hypothetical protein
VLRHAIVLLSYSQQFICKWPGLRSEIANRALTWQELAAVSSDLIAGACEALEQNTSWQIELLNEDRNPIFRVSLLRRWTRGVETGSNQAAPIQLPPCAS